MLQLRLCFFFYLLLISRVIFSQIDSTYIRPFEKDFAVKTYASEKLTGFTKEIGEEETMFNTNNPTSLGVGVSWKNIGVSFSHALGFLRDRDKGRTQSLEFQYHGYTSKFTYDLFLNAIKEYMKIMRIEMMDMLSIRM